MKYETLSLEQMNKLGVGKTITANFLILLLKMYEEKVDEYNELKRQEELKMFNNDNIFNE